MRVHRVGSVVRALKQLPFGKFLTVRQPQLHWRDVIVRNVRRLGLDECSKIGIGCS